MTAIGLSKSDIRDMDGALKLLIHSAVRSRVDIDPMLRKAANCLNARVESISSRTWEKVIRFRILKLSSAGKCKPREVSASPS
jgi:hypothetical protein